MRGASHTRRGCSVLAATGALFVLLLLTQAPPGSAQAGDRDCGDFSTQAAAQDFFIAAGGPSSDPHSLDADGDGVACESNPCPCSSGTGGGGNQPLPVKPTPTPTSKKLKFPATVVDVTDGDTLELHGRGRTFAARLVGIDTPEVYFGAECMGEQASDAMRAVAEGSRVTVRTDPTQDRRDRYGRLLIYADRKGVGDLGRTMISQGLAAVYVYAGAPFRRVERYRAASAAAKASRLGAWSACGGDFHKPL